MRSAGTPSFEADAEGLNVVPRKEAFGRLRRRGKPLSPRTPLRFQSETRNEPNTPTPMSRDSRRMFSWAGAPA